MSNASQFSEHIMSVNVWRSGKTLTLWNFVILYYIFLRNTWIPELKCFSCAYISITSKLNCILKSESKNGNISTVFDYKLSWLCICLECSTYPTVWTISSLTFTVWGNQLHSKRGIDVMDQTIGNYTSKRKTKRWPMALFYSLLDVAALSVYTLLKQSTLNTRKLQYSHN